MTIPPPAPIAPIYIDTAHARDVTFPEFVTLMNQLGAKMTLETQASGAH